MFFLFDSKMEVVYEQHVKKYLRYTVIIVVVGALVYLFSSAFESAIQYYVTIEEIQAAPPSAAHTLKVAGHVKEGTVERTGAAPVTYKFMMTQEGRDLPVIYSGMVPDTFKEGGEVVVTGRLDSAGNFQASHLLAKCASKYEAQPQ